MIPRPPKKKTQTFGGGMPRNVEQNKPNGPVVEMLLQEQNAGREVAVVVLVRNAPPKGTKLPSLLHLIHARIGVGVGVGVGSHPRVSV